ncbi:lipid droplet-associated hydrolase-like [Bolinopsis microptera]|uniref:lipid droplet-associated hydrolase-like n=1 Tax=Bolinopsis microptera TaxID=2820187 RepID=UPI003079928F
MFDFIDNLLSGNEDTMAYICNAVLLTILFITFVFIFVLFQQKSLNRLGYKREYINKNYVNVLYSSNWRDDELAVLLIIPGNPGQAGYYQEYMDLVILHSDEQFRACVVSHVGHSPASDNIFNVRDQIESKLQFITAKLEPGTKIHLIGHSFGAYIALKLFEKGIKLEKSILLFPTFDNMGQMPKAANLRMLLRWQSQITAVAWLTELLPGQLKNKMIQFYSAKFSKNIQDHMSATIAELITPKSLNNVFGLATNEMAVIKDPDFKLIKKFKDKLVFYYGMHDLWAPLDCLRKLRKAVPAVNFHIADEEVLHAFMFSSCKKVALKTVEFLTGNTRYDINNLIPNFEEVAAAARADGDLEYDFCDD